MRDLLFNQEARISLLNGIKTISSAVKSTLGPRGKTVIIESQNHTNGLIVTKDGITVAKSITLEDPVENLAVSIIREASERTGVEAGDGTTTSVVIAEALCEEGMNYPGLNMSAIIKHIREKTDIAVEYLKGISSSVREDTLENVATISSNNDPVIGKIIADAYKEVGLGGLVTVENSMSEKTYSDVTNGMKIDRGFTSRYFINNQKKDECILEDAFVLVTDVEINALLQIESLLKTIVSTNKALLIISPMSVGAINSLAANVVKNELKLANITPPSFGYKSQELMSDIADVTGGVFFSQQAGDDLSLLDMSSLGMAKKITISQESTIIVTDSGEPSHAVKEKITELFVQLENSKKESDRKFIQERISYLKGAIGVIYVGGSSDVEQKELNDRVDDAVCAVRSALEEGILPGGGAALLNALVEIESRCLSSTNKEEAAAAMTMYKALSAPFRTLLQNADHSEESIMLKQSVIQRCESDFYGYDLKNESFCNMLESGIIDPLKVTKNALINAVSVAVTLLSTNAVVTYKRSKNEQ